MNRRLALKSKLKSGEATTTECLEVLKHPGITKAINALQPEERRRTAIANHVRIIAALQSSDPKAIWPEFREIINGETMPV